MNINDLISTEIEKAITDKLPSLIEQKVESMLDDVMSDIFRSYSDTGKTIKSKIEDSLQVNLSGFDLIDYAGLVARHVNQQLPKAVNMEHITSLIRETVGQLDCKKIKLSEVIDWFIQSDMEENPNEAQGEISLHIVEKPENEWVEVFLDIEPGRKKNECRLSFLFSTDRNKIFSVTTGSWSKSKGVVKAIDLVNIEAISHKVFRLYAAQVEIEMDITEGDESYYSSWDRY